MPPGAQPRILSRLDDFISEMDAPITYGLIGNAPDDPALAVDMAKLLDRPAFDAQSKAIKKRGFIRSLVLLLVLFFVFRVVING